MSLRISPHSPHSAQPARGAGGAAAAAAAVPELERDEAPLHSLTHSSREVESSSPLATFYQRPQPRPNLETPLVIKATLIRCGPPSVQILGRETDADVARKRPLSPQESVAMRNAMFLLLQPERFEGGSQNPVVAYAGKIAPFTREGYYLNVMDRMLYFAMQNITCLRHDLLRVIGKEVDDLIPQLFSVKRYFQVYILAQQPREAQNALDYVRDKLNLTLRRLRGHRVDHAHESKREALITILTILLEGVSSPDLAPLLLLPSEYPLVFIDRQPDLFAGIAPTPPEVETLVHTQNFEMTLAYQLRAFGTGLRYFIEETLDRPSQFLSEIEGSREEAFMNKREQFLEAAGRVRASLITCTDAIDRLTLPEFERLLDSRDFEAIESTLEKGECIRVLREVYNHIDRIFTQVEFPRFISTLYPMMQGAFSSLSRKTQKKQQKSFNRIPACIHPDQIASLWNIYVSFPQLQLLLLYVPLENRAEFFASFDQRVERVKSYNFFPTLDIPPNTSKFFRLSDYYSTQLRGLVFDLAREGKEGADMEVTLRPLFDALDKIPWLISQVDTLSKHPSLTSASESFDFGLWRDFEKTFRQIITLLESTQGHLTPNGVHQLEAIRQSVHALYELLSPPPGLATPDAHLVGNVALLVYETGKELELSPRFTNLIQKEFQLQKWRARQLLKDPKPSFAIPPAFEERLLPPFALAHRQVLSQIKENYKEQRRCLRRLIKNLAYLEQMHTWPSEKQKQGLFHLSTLMNAAYDRMALLTETMQTVQNQLFTIPTALLSRREVADFDAYLNAMTRSISKLTNFFNGPLSDAYSPILSWVSFLNWSASPAELAALEDFSPAHAREAEDGPALSAPPHSEESSSANSAEVTPEEPEAVPEPLGDVPVEGFIRWVTLLEGKVTSRIGQLDERDPQRKYLNNMLFHLHSLHQWKTGVAPALLGPSHLSDEVARTEALLVEQGLKFTLVSTSERTDLKPILSQHKTSLLLGELNTEGLSRAEMQHLFAIEQATSSSTLAQDAPKITLERAFVSAAQSVRILLKLWPDAAEREVGFGFDAPPTPAPALAPLFSIIHPDETHHHLSRLRAASARLESCLAATDDRSIKTRRDLTRLDQHSQMVCSSILRSSLKETRGYMARFKETLAQYTSPLQAGNLLVAMSYHAACLVEHLSKGALAMRSITPPSAPRRHILLSPNPVNDRPYRYEHRISDLVTMLDPHLPTGSFELGDDHRESLRFFNHFIHIRRYLGELGGPEAAIFQDLTFLCHCLIQVSEDWNLSEVDKERLREHFGITAPTLEGQKQVLIDAIAHIENTQVLPRLICLIEASELLLRQISET